ncbi:hypothetical protein GWI33_015249 [Rhynchophorus ferrugineus]|uniref:Solute carrier family 12 member 9 n=1 Tax=Rhynchophorus ferrugineus TaxID=354439 RepID=A0A834M8A7_RHYFE|nr:hypothetical protein GWI33_015249 [Rhynchophorus ferrugineus]
MLAPAEGSSINVDNTPLVRTSRTSVMRRISGIFNKNQPTSDESHLNYIELGALSDESNARTLGTFAGVFAPVSLSMFSALIFLRMGYIVGNAGLLITLTQFVIAYVILVFTVSSVCAISTNGAVEGGGAYFMISRTLGPEFGGSIGTLFFLANVVSSALCISGCIEGLVENFGPSGYLVKGIIPGGRWWEFLYSSLLNIGNLIICLIGAAMFAKTTVFVLAIVCISLGITFFSFLYQGEISVPIPDSNTLIQNATYHVNMTYTGLIKQSLENNLFEHYGVTGIMAGANMSGELKNPAKSIPRGTLSAVSFTLVIYLIMSLLVAWTSHTDLLQNNYLYLEGVSVFPASVAVGLFTATWSAALSNVIGGSRVLEALAKDNIFGSSLNFITRGTWNGNPVAAVLISALLVQIVLLIGSLNLIAQLNSVLFLLSYLATNLACLGLEWAGAPNFRPTFAYFTWHTALIGLLGTLIMMFVINLIYAACSILLCLLLVIFLHLFSPSKEVDWGNISQALIFHQVRKYLLLLDSRKDHVKFWRPQILLLVNSPRTACPLIDFINDLKKGGLYVLGHVVKRDIDDEPDPTPDMNLHWLNLVDHLKVKAFVELTVANTLREGLQHLMRLSGMGAMKPNTVILKFLDDEDDAVDFLADAHSPYVNRDFDEEMFPVNSNDNVSSVEYVQMMRDVLRLDKNLCLCRNFAKLKKDPKIVKTKLYIDVWPINFHNPQSMDAFDTTSLFMMQLACIVNMVPLWSKLKLRICIADDSTQKIIDKLYDMLKKLRIVADIVPIAGLADSLESSGTNVATFNDLIMPESADTALTFLYLPPLPPTDEINDVYHENLSMLSQNLPPTIFVRGVSIVTSTTL